MSERTMIIMTRPPRTPPAIFGAEEEEEDVDDLGDLEVLVVVGGGVVLNGELEVTLKMS